MTVRDVRITLDGAAKCLSLMLGFHDQRIGKRLVTENGAFQAGFRHAPCRSVAGIGGNRAQEAFSPGRYRGRTRREIGADTRLRAAQRQLCYDDCEAGAAAWDREHQRIQAEANEARSEAARQQPRTEDGRRLAAKSDSGTTCSTTSLDRHKGREAKADLAGTNRGAVQRALVAARIATLPAHRPGTASIEAVSQPHAAELLNVGRASVQRAREVIDRGAPELVAAVLRGAP